jgi:hypothetical protein
MTHSENDIAEKIGCLNNARQEALWAMVQLSCGVEAIITEPDRAHGILADAHARLSSAIDAMQRYAAIAMPTVGSA